MVSDEGSLGPFFFFLSSMQGGINIAHLEKDINTKCYCSCAPPYKYVYTLSPPDVTAYN